MPEISGGRMDRQMAARRTEANAECRRRIVAVVDEAAQSNLQAEAIVGGLSTLQMETFAEGVQWIKDTRAACHTFYTNLEADLYDDAHWPDVPAGVAELATLF